MLPPKEGSCFHGPCFPQTLAHVAGIFRPATFGDHQLHRAASRSSDSDSAISASLGSGQAENGCSLKSETQWLLLVPASVRNHSEPFSPTVYLWENEMGPEKREKFVHPATL